jgi:hypothetical protein
MTKRKLYPLESKDQRLAPTHVFARRVISSLALAGGVLTVGLSVGVLGYHYVGGLPWIDGLLNSAMILTGMGPVDRLTSDSAKLFASAYALFSGLLFITVIAVVLSPLLHRFLHKFHLDDRDMKK